ncbi:MAG: hypothetical protein AB7O47_08095 [Flavobacteriales bacterium]
MKKLLLLSFTLCCIVIGCKKENLLGDLEANKWEQDVSNFITVDSSYAIPVSPSYGDIWVFISFNESSIQQEWANIKTIHVQYQKYMFNSPTGTLFKDTVPYSNGRGTYAPNSTTNNTNYRFQFYIEFDNGRTTALSPMYSITTPPF